MTILDITQLEVTKVAAGTCVGLIVNENTGIQDRLTHLQQQGINCACIAYVVPGIRRKRRQMALSLGLAQCHNCPCAVFDTRSEAEAWLARHLH